MIRNGGLARFSDHFVATRSIRTFTARKRAGSEDLIQRIDATPSTPLPALRQVGALPVRFEEGKPQVMLLTSRGTKRWVIPKGWPMRGKKNWAAAAQEAKEEAGIIGKTYKKPVGEFLYFKRRAAHFDLCSVEVYVLNVEKRLDSYREKGQREARWFALEDATDRVQEPGLTALLRDLDLTRFHKPTKKKLVDKPRKKARGKT
jgi:8-oxo-dGTP pyrophosphatase MutT (NUDIX family)